MNKLLSGILRNVEINPAFYIYIGIGMSSHFVLSKYPYKLSETVLLFEDGEYKRQWRHQQKLRIARLRTLKRCDQAYSTEAYSNNHRKLWHKTLEINPDSWCTVLGWNVIQPLHHVPFPPRNVHAYLYSHIIKCLCYSYWNCYSNYCSQWILMVISILKRTFESVSE